MNAYSFNIYNFHIKRFPHAFNAPFALESYAEVFDQEDALDRLESFASKNGPEFYGVPINSNSITLVKLPQFVPSSVIVKNIGNSVEKLVPFHGGETLNWKVLVD